MNGITSFIGGDAHIQAWEPPQFDAPTGILGKLHNLFSPPQISGQTIDDAKASFRRYFEEEVGVLANHIDPKGLDGFSKSVQERFNAIMEKTFQQLPIRSDGSVSSKTFNVAITKAGKAASMALDRLKLDASREQLLSEKGVVNIQPQVIRHDGKFVVIRQAPQIENLVLRGGGAKGIGYSAALEQMEKSGMLGGVKHIAGSSAGALTATCLACGMTATEFEKGPADKLFRPNIRSIRSELSELIALIPGFNGSKVYPELKMSGGGLLTALASLQVMDEVSANGIGSYLRDHWNTETFQTKLAELHASETAKGNDGDAAVARLAQLRELPDFTNDRTGKMVTFNDMRLMNELAPDKFKQLTITGWDKTNQRETYFNATNSPDMPVAYAARISMAFPLAFKGITVDPGDGGGTRNFADGGIGSNMPSEAFTGSPGTGLTPQNGTLEETNARTLLLTFDEGGKAYSIMHNPPPPPPTPPSGVLGHLSSAFSKIKGVISATFINFITNHPDQDSTNVNDRQNVRNAGPNALPIFHGDLGTLSPVLGEKMHQVNMLSAWKSLEQISTRQNQAYASEFTSIDQIAKSLTPDEKQALLDADPSKLSEPERHLCMQIKFERDPPLLMGGNMVLV